MPPRAPVRAREPEIGQLHLPVACIQQVVRLQILQRKQQKKKRSSEAKAGVRDGFCIIYLYNGGYCISDRKSLDVVLHASCDEGT